MQWNKPLFFIALGNSLVNLVIADYLDTQVSHTQLEAVGQGFIGIFLFVFWWFVVFVLTLVLSIIQRKSWFQPAKLFSTLVFLVFCTPLPTILFLWFYLLS
jgi:hypothetical protein